MFVLAAALDLGMTTRVIGITTAATTRRTRMIMRRMNAHKGIPQQRRLVILSSEREEP